MSNLVLVLLSNEIEFDVISSICTSSFSCSHAAWVTRLCEFGGSNAFGSRPERTRVRRRRYAFNASACNNEYLGGMNAMRLASKCAFSKESKQVASSGIEASMRLMEERGKRDENSVNEVIGNRLGRSGNVRMYCRHCRRQVVCMGLSPGRNVNGTVINETRGGSIGAFFASTPYSA